MVLCIRILVACQVAVMWEETLLIALAILPMHMPETSLSNYRQSEIVSLRRFEHGTS
jgi:hypothetical protein